MSNRRGSGSCCSAIGCSMRRGTNLLSQVKMFKFPTDPTRRAAWCNALKRANWTPNKNSLLCNAHFVTGKSSMDSQHPDYIPSIFNFNQKAAEEGEKKLKRYERNTKRQKHDSVTEDSSTDNAGGEMNQILGAILFFPHSESRFKVYQDLMVWIYIFLMIPCL